MDLDGLRHRYFHDAEFNAAVRMMTNLVRRGHLTPIEVRQAAFLAAVQIEMELRQPPRLCSCGDPDCDRPLDYSL